MSFYEESSIVITPNAYKAGTLYAVVPTSGLADMDVTRATAATRVDESGLVNYAEVIEDSILTGNNSTFDTGIGSWVTYNGGTLAHSTDKLEVTLTSGESGARINTDSLISGGQSGKTFKVRAKIWKGTSTNSTIAIFIGGAQKFITISSTPTYFEAELTAANTSMLTIYRAAGAGGVGTYFIDDVTVKQVDRDNVPRIDYTGGGCPHILSEPQRTNLITYSEEISQYSKTSGVTVIDNSTTSPDGATNASKVTKSGQSANDRVYINNLVILDATDYSISAFIKNSDVVSGGVSTISARNNGGILFRQGYEWDGSDLSITSSFGGGTRTNVLLEDFGNGWWKIGFSFTSDSTSADIECDVDRENGTDTTAIFLWGAQLEEGSYPTSYIPTSGASVTRNQDQFTRDGISSLINSTEGVLFVEMAALADDGTNRYLSINDGTINNYVYFRFMTTSNRVLMRTVVSGVTINTLQITISDTTAFNKYAIKWKSGDYAFWINGVEELVDPSATVFSADVLNRIDFSFPTGDNFPAKIKQLQVYPSALSDAELTTLTTP